MPLPRILTVPSSGDRLRSALILRMMESEYDPEREAVAAIKHAAGAVGADRQRWIRTALVWIQHTHLRAPTPERRGAGELV